MLCLTDVRSVNISSSFFFVQLFHHRDGGLPVTSCLCRSLFVEDMDMGVPLLSPAIVGWPLFLSSLPTFLLHPSPFFMFWLAQVTWMFALPYIFLAQSWPCLGYKSWNIVDVPCSSTMMAWHVIILHQFTMGCVIIQNKCWTALHHILNKIQDTKKVWHKEENKSQLIPWLESLIQWHQHVCWWYYYCFQQMASFCKLCQKNC